MPAIVLSTVNTIFTALVINPNTFLATGSNDFERG